MCSGTILISEANYRIFLHELVLDPEPQLHLIADLQGPEPWSEGKQDQYVFAAWAPDGSAVLLQYNITDYEDKRGLEFSEDSCFEVSCLAATPQFCSGIQFVSQEQHSLHQHAPWPYRLESILTSGSSPCYLVDMTAASLVAPLLEHQQALLPVQAIPRAASAHRCRPGSLLKAGRCCRWCACLTWPPGP